MKNKKILIYGANGYTGKLFAQHLIEKGNKPILAARSNKVEKPGEELNCETRIFDTRRAQDHLNDVDVLVNMAGPFSSTQNDLIISCIQSKTHYLDIAGEFAEVENAYKYDSEAKKAKIVVLPAAGFGVAPTDIAAKLACQKVDNPEQLIISYATVGSVSRGTLKTVLKDIQKSGWILQNGQYSKARPAQSYKMVTVFDKKFKAVYNPWRADLFTARLSTGAKNIETYSEFPGFVVSMMNGKLLWLRNLLLNRLIKRLPEGPSKKQLDKGKTYINAIAVNDKNESGIINIKGPEAYLFTVMCLEQIILKILADNDLSGCLTPSMLGTDFLEDIPGVQIQ